MKIIDRWNEFMGPKDERLTAEANRCAAVGYTILIIGSVLCLYYGIMLNQVAETTGHPLLTPLGQSVFPVDTALLIIILASGLISNWRRRSMALWKVAANRPKAKKNAKVK